MLIDPVECLPPELMLKVLSEVRGRVGVNSVKRKLRPFLKLRQVSAEWDRFVMSIPANFSGSYVSIETASQMNSFSEFLEKSKDRKVRFLSVFVSSRWNDAPLISIPQEAFASIEKLTISCPFSQLREIMQSVLPCLTSVKLLDLVVRADLTGSGEIDLSAASGIRAVQVAVDLPVETVSLTFANFPATPFFETFTLSKIKRLALISAQDPTRALQNVDTSALTTLKLRGTCISQCLQVLSDRGVRLSSLELSNEGTSDSFDKQLLQCDLGCLDDLQELSLDASRFTKAQISRLITCAGLNLHKFALSGMHRAESFDGDFLAEACPQLDELTLLGIVSRDWVRSVMKELAQRPGPRGLDLFSVKTHMIAPDELLGLFMDTGLRVKKFEFENEPNLPGERDNYKETYEGLISRQCIQSARDRSTFPEYWTTGSGVFAARRL